MYNVKTKRTEPMCPCNRCLKCCCEFVDGLTPSECINAEYDGICDCGKVSINKICDDTMSFRTGIDDHLLYFILGISFVSIRNNYLKMKKYPFGISIGIDFVWNPGFHGLLIFLLERVIWCKIENKKLEIKLL